MGVARARSAGLSARDRGKGGATFNIMDLMGLSIPDPARTWPIWLPLAERPAERLKHPLGCRDTRERPKGTQWRLYRLSGTLAPARLGPLLLGALGSR